MYSVILQERRRRDARGEPQRFVQHRRGLVGLAAWVFRHTADATAVRLIVRRVQPAPGSQLALFVHYS